MEAIKGTVENIIENLRLKQLESLKEDPGALLKKTLTKKELGHIKFNYFKKGVLSLNVDSSSWLYHLSLRKDELLNKLRKDSSTVKEIRFYLGEIK